MKKSRANKEVSAGTLIDELIEDILSASDREILEDEDEFLAYGARSSQDVLSAALTSAQIAIGKERYAEAARRLAESDVQRSNVLALNRDRLRKEYEGSIQESRPELSMAARGGTRITEKDVDSAIDDLVELNGLGKKDSSKR